MAPPSKRQAKQSSSSPSAPAALPLPGLAIGIIAGVAAAIASHTLLSKNQRKKKAKKNDPHSPPSAPDQAQSGPLVADEGVQEREDGSLKKPSSSSSSSSPSSSSIHDPDSLAFDDANAGRYAQDNNALTLPQIPPLPVDRSLHMAGNGSSKSTPSPMLLSVESNEVSREDREREIGRGRETGELNLGQIENMHASHHALPSSSESELAPEGSGISTRYNTESETDLRCHDLENASCCWANYNRDPSLSLLTSGPESSHMVMNCEELNLRHGSETAHLNFNDESNLHSYGKIYDHGCEHASYSQSDPQERVEEPNDTVSIVYIEGFDGSCSSNGMGCCHGSVTDSLQPIAVLPNIPPIMEKLDTGCERYPDLQESDNGHGKFDNGCENPRFPLTTEESDNGNGKIDNGCDIPRFQLTAEDPADGTGMVDNGYDYPPFQQMTENSGHGNGKVDNACESPHFQRMTEESHKGNGKVDNNCENCHFQLTTEESDFDSEDSEVAMVGLHNLDKQPRIQQTVEGFDKVWENPYLQKTVGNSFENYNLQPSIGEEADDYIERCNIHKMMPRRCDYGNEIPNPRATVDGSASASERSAIQSTTDDLDNILKSVDDSDDIQFTLDGPDSASEKLNIQPMLDDSDNILSAVDVSDDIQPTVDDTGKIQLSVDDSNNIQPSVDDSDNIRLTVDASDSASEQCNVQPMLDDSDDIKPAVDVADEIQPAVYGSDNIQLSLDDSDNIKPLVNDSGNTRFTADGSDNASENPKIQPLVDDSDNIQPIVDDSVNIRPAAGESDSASENLDIQPRVNDLGKPDFQSTMDEKDYSIRMPIIRTRIEEFDNDFGRSNLQPRTEGLDSGNENLNLQPIMEEPVHGVEKINLPSSQEELNDPCLSHVDDMDLAFQFTLDAACSREFKLKSTISELDEDHASVDVEPNNLQSMDQGSDGSWRFDISSKHIDKCPHAQSTLEMHDGTFTNGQADVHLIEAALCDTSLGIDGEEIMPQSTLEVNNAYGEHGHPLVMEGTEYTLQNSDIEPDFRSIIKDGNDCPSLVGEEVNAKPTMDSLGNPLQKQECSLQLEMEGYVREQHVETTEQDTNNSCLNTDDHFNIKSAIESFNGICVKVITSFLFDDDANIQLEIKSYDDICAGIEAEHPSTVDGLNAKCLSIDEQTDLLSAPQYCAGTDSCGTDVCLRFSNLQAGMEDSDDICSRSADGQQTVVKAHEDIGLTNEREENMELSIKGTCQAYLSAESVNNIEHVYHSNAVSNRNFLSLDEDHDYLQSTEAHLGDTLLSKDIALDLKSGYIDKFIQTEEHDNIEPTIKQSSSIVHNGMHNVQSTARTFEPICSSLNVKHGPQITTEWHELCSNSNEDPEKPIDYSCLNKYNTPNDQSRMELPKIPVSLGMDRDPDDIRKLNSSNDETCLTSAKGLIVQLETGESDGDDYLGRNVVPDVHLMIKECDTAFSNQNVDRQAETCLTTERGLNVQTEQSDDDLRSSAATDVQLMMEECESTFLNQIADKLTHPESTVECAKDYCSASDRNYNLQLREELETYDQPIMEGFDITIPNNHGKLKHLSVVEFEVSDTFSINGVPMVLEGCNYTLNAANGDEILQPDIVVSDSTHESCVSGNDELNGEIISHLNIEVSDAINESRLSGDDECNHEIRMEGSYDCCSIADAYSDLQLIEKCVAHETTECSSNVHMYNQPSDHENLDRESRLKVIVVHEDKTCSSCNTYPDIQSRQDKRDHTFVGVQDLPSLTDGNLNIDEKSGIDSSDNADLKRIMGFEEISQTSDGELNVQSKMEESVDDSLLNAGIVVVRTSTRETFPSAGGRTHCESTGDCGKDTHGHYEHCSIIKHADICGNDASCVHPKVEECDEFYFVTDDKLNSPSIDSVPRSFTLQERDDDYGSTPPTVFIVQPMIEAEAHLRADDGVVSCDNVPVIGNRGWLLPDPYLQPDMEMESSPSTCPNVKGDHQPVIDKSNDILPASDESQFKGEGFQVSCWTANGESDVKSTTECVVNASVGVIDEQLHLQSTVERMESIDGDHHNLESIVEVRHEVSEPKLLQGAVAESDVASDQFTSQLVLDNIDDRPIFSSTDGTVSNKEDTVDDKDELLLRHTMVGDLEDNNGVRHAAVDALKGHSRDCALIDLPEEHVSKSRDIDNNAVQEFIDNNVNEKRKPDLDGMEDKSSHVDSSGVLSSEERFSNMKDDDEPGPLNGSDGAKTGEPLPSVLQTKKNRKRRKAKSKKVVPGTDCHAEMRMLQRQRDKWLPHQMEKLTPYLLITFVFICLLAAVTSIVLQYLELLQPLPRR